MKAKADANVAGKVRLPHNSENMTLVAAAVCVFKGLLCVQSKLSPTMVYYYRLPALVHSWDWGIVRFAESALRSAISPLWAVRRESLNERFKATTLAHNIPVCIIHGQQDVIVPISNSTRLSASLGQVQLVRIVNCGHNCAEETPECFVAEIARFVNNEVLVHGDAVHGGGAQEDAALA